MVPRQLIVRIVALRHINWHAHHLLHPQPTRRSSSRSHHSQQEQQLQERFWNFHTLHLQSHFSSKGRTTLFHFVLIFTTRVSLFPWLGWKLLCLRLINQQDNAIFFSYYNGKGCYMFEFLDWGCTNPSYYFSQKSSYFSCIGDYYWRGSWRMQWRLLN